LQLASSYLYVLCQGTADQPVGESYFDLSGIALDLRALQHEQFGKMQEVLRAEAWKYLHYYVSTEQALDALCAHLAPIIRDAFAANTTKDARPLMESVAAACTAPLLEFLASSLSHDPPKLGNEPPSSVGLLSSMAEFRASFVEQSAASLQDLRKKYLEYSGEGSTGVFTPELLADGTRPVYEFVRSELGIGLRGLDSFSEFRNGHKEPLVGDDVSQIHDCIRSGRMAEVLMKVFGKAID
jgi:phenylalanine ammonia-lyase